MVRAEISAEEWQQLRILALQQNTAPKTIIGGLIRAYLAKAAKR